MFVRLGGLIPGIITANLERVSVLVLCFSILVEYFVQHSVKKERWHNGWNKQVPQSQWKQALSQDITGMTLLTDYKYQFHQAICIEKEGLGIILTILNKISVLP